MKNTNYPEGMINDKSLRFSKAVKTAIEREKGLHGSVGTQNEKLIHAALKNYYSPFSDEQEIRIGSYFADAVCEDGIFEIQTRQLYKLCNKLRAFLEFSRVTVVYPVIAEYHTLYINGDSGELARITTPRKLNSKLKMFEELYSIREFLTDEKLRLIIVRLKVEKRVYFHGETPPDMRNKRERKKCVIEKIPLEIIDETELSDTRDYRLFLPEKLPLQFTKKQLSKAAGESSLSLRTEVLRTVGIIRKIGKIKNEFLYEINGKGE